MTVATSVPRTRVLRHSSLTHRSSTDLVTSSVVFLVKLQSTKLGQGPANQPNLRNSFAPTYRCRCTNQWPCDVCISVSVWTVMHPMPLTWPRVRRKGPREEELEGLLNSYSHAQIIRWTRVRRKRANVTFPYDLPRTLVFVVLCTSYPFQVSFPLQLVLSPHTAPTRRRLYIIPPDYQVYIWIHINISCMIEATEWCFFRRNNHPVKIIS